MTLSRRAFVHTLGVGGAFVLSGGLVAARGREAFVGMGMPDREPGWSDWVPGLDEPSAIRLSSNENPNGPGDRALDAIRAALGESNRYPFVFAQSVTAAIAKRQGVKEENVLVGCGSGEILRMSVMAFTSPSKPLVVASPTYEDPEHTAEAFGTPVRRVQVNPVARARPRGMAAQSGGAGLVFLCNPNNPTGTVHAAGAVADFIGEVRKASPDAIVLADEAYHEYVDDPGYKTAIPLALEDPHVIVSRTFSKVYGMAGLRLGYAIARKETIERLRRYRLANDVNVLAAAAGVATIADDERIAREQRLNREAREYTRKALADMGFPSRPSNANFIMVPIHRPAKDFQEASASRACSSAACSRRSWTMRASRSGRWTRCGGRSRCSRACWPETAAFARRCSVLCST